jgi:3-oxoacyl-[acyl-carrier-protein] synthase-1
MTTGSSRVVVAGVGMMTSVGLTAPETAGSIRASIARYGESRFTDPQFDPYVLAEVPDGALPRMDAAERVNRAPRDLRLLRLGIRPLLEALAALPKDAEPPPLALALPELRANPADSHRFLETLSRHVHGRFDVVLSTALDHGRAGALRAIDRAADAVRSGRVKFAIAGAIDTYRDEEILAALERDERVKTATRLDGFIPGEGAAFVLLANEAHARKASIRPLAALTRVALADEPGHLYSDVPYRGDGLAGALTALLASGEVSAPIADVLSSMNGESHWAKEWGVAFVRNRAAFRDGHGMHHPADCFGETGAACGPLLIGLAAFGIRDGYCKSPCLVYCSSDRGPRAALAVTTV